MTTKSQMNDRRQRLLTAILRLEQEHAAQPRPTNDGGYFETRVRIAGEILAWDAAAAHGPLIAWLNDSGTEAERKANARSLRVLVAEGLVEQTGDRVKLTPAGLVAIG